MWSWDVPQVPTKTTAGTAVIEFCHDCGKPFGPTDKRLILGERKYHADTCGPILVAENTK